MTLGSSISQLIESMMRNVGISSASPEWTNRIKDMSWFGETPDFDSVISADVVQIIKDEVKLQMTQLEDPAAEPLGSAITEQEAIGVARQGLNVVQNPGSLVAMGLKVLPGAAIVAFAIQLTPIIFEELTRPGSAMDLRWKRMIKEENLAFLDRQTQRNIELGLRQVISTNSRSFIAVKGGTGTYNNLASVRENVKMVAEEVTRVDHAKEVFGN